nr:hypothetical protein [Burkholderia pyrrocinia]
MNDWTRPVYGTATSTLRHRAADSASGRNAGSWHPLLTASSSIRTEPKTPVAGPAAHFHDNPLVSGTQPRSLEPDELALLGDLADMTECEIAALHFAPPTRSRN